MTGAVEVRRTSDDDLDPELVEGWERVVDPGEFERRFVDASLSADAEWAWSVGVAAMEFVREEPLESDLRDGVIAAIAAVPGVSGVSAEDREVWIVDGTPTGADLVRAVAEVVDRFAPRFDF